MYLSSCHLWEHTKFATLSKFCVPFDLFSPLFILSSSSLFPSSSTISFFGPPAPLFFPDTNLGVSPEPPLFPVPDTASPPAPNLSPRRSIRVSNPSAHLLGYQYYYAILSHHIGSSMKHMLTLCGTKLCLKSCRL